MGLPGLDCSHPISGEAVADAGYRFVMRYQSSIPGPKILTRPEAEQLLAAGVAVGQVYEDTRDDANTGAAGGDRHGRKMVEGMQECGTPVGSGAYFADDQNRTKPWEVIDHFAAAGRRARDAGFRPGYYGGFVVARALLDAMVVDLAWVVATWHPAGDVDTSRFHIAQLPNSGQPIVGGVECDLNETLSSDPGLWWPTPPTPTPEPPIVVTRYPEEHMKHLEFTVGGNGRGTDAQGNGYTDLFDVPWGTLTNAYPNTAGYAAVPDFKGAENADGHVRIQWHGAPNLPPFGAHAFVLDTPAET